MQSRPVYTSIKSSRCFNIFLGAAMLFAAALGCSRQTAPPAEEEPAVDRSQPPIHAFITSDRSIDCPVVGGVGTEEIFARQPPLCWLTDGWSRAHDWGTWATRKTSRFEIHLDKPLPRTLVLRARTSENLPEEQKQTVGLRVNGHALGIQEVRRDISSLRFEIPANDLHAGRNHFALEFVQLTPAVGSATDRVEVSQAARIAEMSLVAQKHRNDRADTSGVDVWEPGRESLVIDRPGILVLPVFVPMDATELELELRSGSAASDIATSARLSVLDLDGNVAQSNDIEIASGGDASVGRLSTTELAGRWALVTITPETDKNAVTVASPHFVTRKLEDQDTDTLPDQGEPRRPPDIILITLDAARADCFSFNGHHRRTTPFIDSLTEESLVFANAFSLVPYTLGSVPTMITGLSFLDHGVVAHKDVLSADAVTLAESLREAGYRTAAFSASPNNSKLKGFDQGYDVFREMWTEGEQKVTRRAPYIARRVVEWLEENPDDGHPLHLQVHMLPPHAPYDPPPVFDRYRDPDYDGPCDGWPRTVYNLNAGVVPGTPECVEHVLALYDGNLNVADDATRVIVEALRRRPNWDNTLVLVTSDHGEAFMEHDRIGHNSTLYTEMMHVPFVLRMPEGTNTEGIDTRGLVTLADIVPTLLHAAGVTPPGLTDGIDLLDRGIGRKGRFMAGRTASIPPVLGLRTLRWNLMVNSAGSGGLFDLTADPGEMQNLVGEHPEIYAGLGKILATRVAVPPQLNASETSDLSDEERALLETLGYIR